MQTMRFTMSEIADSVRDLGYRGKEHWSEGITCVESATSGKIFSLYCYDTESNALSDAESEASLVRFGCSWIVSDGYDQNKLQILCNWFNAEKPFSKSYVRSSAEDTLVIVEADLYVLDGMTNAAFKHQLSIFIAHLENFQKHLSSCSTIPKSQLVENHNKALSLLHGDGDAENV